MLFNIRSLLALPFVGLALHASFSEAGVVRAHRHSFNAHSHLHQRSSHVARRLAQRDASTQQLQTEAKAFSSWMESFIKSANATNSASSLSQVQDEIKGHQAAVKSFIDSATNGQSMSSASLSVLQSENDAFKGWSDAWLSSAGSMSATDAKNQLSMEIQAYTGWLDAWLAQPASFTVSPSPPSPPVVSSVAPAPTATQAATPAPVAPSPASSSEPSTSTEGTVSTQAPKPPAPSPTDPSPPAYSSPSADPSPSPSSRPSNTGSSNLAVWWGQSGAASSYDLSKMCSDPSVDIVILAFLNKFFEQNNMPTLNLGPATGKMTRAQSSAGADGLFDGSSLVPAIQACQKSGKKVMLSLGGAQEYSSSKFTDDGQAEKFATTMWNLFLGGKSDLRPFGSTVLDGIDVGMSSPPLLPSLSPKPTFANHSLSIDNENHDTTGYTTFVSSLRSHFSSDASRTYYISAAPQCPRPDASIPLDAMKRMDFVWVQFYNNAMANCDHGQQGDGSDLNPGFSGSLKNWSKDLSGSGAKLYVAAVADATQGSGFIDTSTLSQEIESVKKMGLSNFGGYALWDGSLAMKNGDMQKAVKQALTA